MTDLPGIWGQWGGYLPFFVAGFLVSEPWRWAGALVGRNVDPDSVVFAWVRAVSTAIVAGLVTRMLVFPSGALQLVSLEVRATAFAAGIAVYLAFGRNLAIGIAGGIGMLLAGPKLLPLILR